MVLSAPPDLRVTSVVVPERRFTGQPFDLTYTVTNSSSAATSALQVRWDDLFYLSSDQFLDLKSDHFLGVRRHTGGLAAGQSYTETQTLRLPRGLLGPFYVFVVTDPIRNQESGVGTAVSRGEVFEGDHEANNATPSPAPMLIELPPPSDLQVDAVQIVSSSARPGDEVSVQWTVSNHRMNPAAGTWTDALYLSTDAVWDIDDRPLGRFAFSGTLAKDQSYTRTELFTLPAVRPGSSYRVIVRTDVLNDVFEGPDEANNRTASENALSVTVDALALGVPRATTLSTGQVRIFQVSVGADQTLRVTLTTPAQGAAHELFLRHGDVPTGIAFDAAYDGPLQPNQTAVIASTTPGVYFVLIRGQSEPAPNTPVTLLADLVPFQITDVVTDRGGDSRYVTATIRGAQFHKDAIVKLVRPGFAEYEPVRYQVVDSTRIQAIFDLRDAPHGLYDVKVINPGGQEAIVPYRYLVERALEPEVMVGLGGDRVLQAGDTGRYGVSLQSLTNVDLPYVHFQFGIPEVGTNSEVFNLKRVSFSTNLRGAPAVADVPWASLDAAVNTNGEIMAPGYVLDLANRGFAGASFTVETYPGLREILDRDFQALKAKIEGLYPQYSGLLEQKGPAGLVDIDPLLAEVFANLAKPLDDVDPCDVAFRFHIQASATPLTRNEFLTQQRAEAAKLRAGILQDPQASRALMLLASDLESWTGLYLTALEQAGLLRPEDQPPEVRDNPKVISLMSVLAAGVLAGPAGNQIITSGNLLEFFAQVRRWYGDNPNLVGSGGPPPAEMFDLKVSSRTVHEAFNIFVNFGKCQLDLQGGGTAPTDFAPFFAAQAGGTQSVGITGPVGQGDQQFVPLGLPLPYTVRFENVSGAARAVGEVRVLVPLDSNLDPFSFRLGDLRLGDIQVHIPDGRGAFGHDFTEFLSSKGFILRISAGLDFGTNTAVWLLQAIDPDTGDVLEDPDRGLLPPNNAQGRGAGFVTYTVKPKDGLATGSTVAAQARVLFNTSPPEDTQRLVHHVDGAAPVTAVTANAVGQSGADYEVKWSAADDAGGSGVKHVTVYVAEDGGDFTIWLRRTTETQGVYQGRVGHTYEFLALATDQAGNREEPRFGRQAPGDGPGPNLGTLPSVPETTVPDLGPPAPPSSAPASNPLFVEAERGIAAAAPISRQSEFQSVLRPFTVQSFATEIPQSHAGIGPMAIVVFPDRSVLASGGPTRGQLFRFTPEGGAAGAPFADLPYPIFDMALDQTGKLWATTGGGPLLQLDPTSGAILSQFGDGLTQSLAVDPASGRIFVSSGDGIEIFDPAAHTFRHYSDVRVGSLAFAPDGKLWAALWPKRGDVIRFDRLDDRAKPQVMLHFDTDVDSLAFGLPGTALQGLLLVTHNRGLRPTDGSELTLVDLATLRRVAVATGGTRGDIIKAAADGRVLLSQSQQIDVFSPVVAPRVTGTSPPSGALAALPLGSVSVTFDRDMFVGPADDPHSVLNPVHYELRGQTAGLVPSRAVSYDVAGRVAVLSFDALAADQYQLRVATTLRSAAGLALAETHTASFTAVADLTTLIRLEFANARSLRGQETVSYNVTVTNTSNNDLLLPLVLELAPTQHFEGEPLGTQGRSASGGWLIDLSQNLQGGLLRRGQATVGRTITVRNPGAQRVAFDPFVSALTAPNVAPVFASPPLTTATAGEPYRYLAVARDPEGDAISYLLHRAPRGMTIDARTGLVSWAPTAASPQRADVALLAYDTRGASATQEFTVQVEGVNRAPVLDLLPAQIEGREGEPLTITVKATDADGDSLVYWADRLPPGAVFDADLQTLSWTPSHQAAGTYANVRFIVSDGVHQVSQAVTLLIAPSNQAPALARPADRAVREGDAVRIQLSVTDPEGAALTFSSDLLPGGATLDPRTGLFEWTPAHFQHGVFDIPFTVSDGERATTQTTRITVLNVNAAPVFDELGIWQVHEGQRLRFQAFAFDADNPAFVPQLQLADGTLTELESSPPTVTYTASGLPAGATFDAQTATFEWTPGFTQAGDYLVTVTATDDGDGTGTPSATTRTVPIHVLNSNHAPVVAAISNQTVNRGAVLDVPIQATDADGNPLVLSVIDLPHFGTLVDHGDGTRLLHFAPGSGDRGSFTMTVTASDNGDGVGPGAALAGSHSFVLTVKSPNEAPQLTLIGDKMAIIGQPLTFTLRATDLDQDALTFTAVGLPAGATLVPGSVYGTATFAWTPTAAQAGTHVVTFQVTDSGNGNPALIESDQQTIRLVARAMNAAPVLAPVGNRVVAEGQTLTISLAAADPDGDSLLYSASNLPLGATFDPLLGTLRWTPNLFQATRYPGIVFTATDGNRASSETIAIDVTKTNQAPVLTPLFPQSGREGTELQFALAAGDPDGDALSFSVLSGLPTGARFDFASGQFQWTPSFDQAGGHTVRFSVQDAGGLTSATDVFLNIVNVDRPPSLHVSSHAVKLGQLLTFSVQGTDPDAEDSLTFGANGLPAGASLDATSGQFQWTPGPGQLGDYVVTFSVSDGQAIASQTVLLRAALQPASPRVTVELTPSFPALPGQRVQVHVAAASLADIVGLHLFVDGRPVTLDAQGRATVVAGAPGRMVLEASATDADGLVGRTSTMLKVRNPSDTAAPIVTFGPGLNGARLTEGTDIVATISDSNLDSWRLEFAPFSSGMFTPLAGGNSPMDKAALVRFDPFLVANGVYRLRLLAVDMSGRASSAEIVVEANTPTKPTQYRRSATDLTVQLGGVAIALVREYDSLGRDRSGTFGFGWRLANRDMHIETNVPSTRREEAGVYNPFRIGTRVYLTLPDGRTYGADEPQRGRTSVCPVCHRSCGPVFARDRRRQCRRLHRADIRGRRRQHRRPGRRARQPTTQRGPGKHRGRAAIRAHGGRQP